MKIDRHWWDISFALFAVLSLSSMAGMSIGGGIFLACSLFFLYSHWSLAEGEYFRKLLCSPYARISGLLFLISFLSLVVAALFPPKGPSASGFAELKKFHHFLYPFFVALALEFSNAKKGSRFWCWWMAMGVFSSFIAVVQFWAGSLFPAEWLDSRFFRAAGSTGKFHGQGLMYFHLSFASCMPFVAAPGLARALWPKKEENFGKRMLWLGIGLLGALATFYSYSRIAWVSVFFLFLALAFLKKPRWGFFAFFLFTLMAIGVWNTSDSMRKRWNDSRAGIFERQTVWAGALEMLKERPILGVGFGRTGHYSSTYSEIALGRKPEFSSHAHNNFLDILASTGLLGFLIFSAWWLYLFFESWKSFRLFPEEEKWLPAATMAALFSFQINGLTQVNFWDGKSQHTLMIFCGVVLYFWMRRKAASG